MAPAHCPGLIRPSRIFQPAVGGRGSAMPRRALPAPPASAGDAANLGYGSIAFQGTDMRTTLALAPLALLAVGAIDLTAQTVWTANATTAVPNFQANGTVKTTTVDTTVHGRGVRPRLTPEG